MSVNIAIYCCIHSTSNHSVYSKCWYTKEGSPYFLWQHEAYAANFSWTVYVYDQISYLGQVTRHSILNIFDSLIIFIDSGLLQEKTSSAYNLWMELCLYLSKKVLPSVVFYQVPYCQDLSNTFLGLTVLLQFHHHGK